eukprot:SAG31_NODE_5198_length_2682_cov_1.861789_2_plen_64_part_00
MLAGLMSSPKIVRDPRTLTLLGARNTAPDSTNNDNIEPVNYDRSSYGDISVRWMMDMHLHAFW